MPSPIPLRSCRVTFAVVAGAVGGGFQGTVIINLGFANLVADGFSMAVENAISEQGVCSREGGGRFSGYAWSANCGWLNLGDGSFFVKTDTVAPGADSDGDGITDAWELREAGNLTALTAAGDHDGDGASDLSEYLADTGPLDPLDALRIVNFARATDGTKVTLEWTSQPTRRYRITENHDLLAPWTLALDNILPDAGLTTTRGLGLTPGDVQHFYKVGAYRPLSE